MPLQTDVDAAGSPASNLMRPLTRKEVIVLERLAAGLSNKQIARELSLSCDSVKFHLKNVYGKLGAVRRGHAVSIAQQFRLIPPH